MNIAALHNALALVAPIVGVSVGNSGDRSSWRIDFADGATDDQKSAAQGVIASFDLVNEDRSFLPQEMLAQLEPADMLKINAAISADASGQMALLWAAFLGQRDPISIMSDRYLAGAAGMTAALGDDRWSAIKKAIGIA